MSVNHQTNDLHEKLPACMSSLWENSRIRDNNCFYNSKTLSVFFLRLDSGGVSRPSWGARCMRAHSL